MTTGFFAFAGVSRRRLSVLVYVMSPSTIRPSPFSFPFSPWLDEVEFFASFLFVVSQAPYLFLGCLPGVSLRSSTLIHPSLKEVPLRAPPLQHQHTSCRAPPPDFIPLLKRYPRYAKPGDAPSSIGLLSLGY